MSSASRTPEVLEITSSGGVVQARQLVRGLAQECRFSLVEQTKLITAASELARNTLIHGGGGSMTASVVEERGLPGVRLVFTDRGPGIADVELALTDGWTSGGGMGLGLSGSRRLVSDFVLDSTVGQGTTVTVTKWAR
ncbi:anti-sigma regulatory factor [Streptomyces sp. BH-SS-21]|uniref:Anti-sigma regulatory factor n=1 Tax=Streptomyces liliiviolaceus TaxID=2823109 RepID=A0A940YAB4_9ACTN|nr:ATP-binding protein [Streptomyces liliiviolaceus]MBQ0855510.1 anti-sigma regulatory factor [Streptomyces liliiviolaceus]